MAQHQMRVPDDLHELLVRVAQANDRTTAAQLRVSLANALRRELAELEQGREQ